MHEYRIPQTLHDLYTSTESMSPENMSPKLKMEMLVKLENLIFNLRKMDDKEIEANQVMGHAERRELQKLVNISSQPETVASSPKDIPRRRTSPF